MPTVLKILRGALNEIGVLAQGEDPATGDGDDALDLFNDFVDALGAERLAMYTVLRTAHTLTASRASDSIGPGGDINIERPLWIDAAMLVIDTTASIPAEISLEVLTDQGYAAWPNKTMEASQSRAIYYDHAFSSSGRGSVSYLPIPDVGTTQLVLYTPQAPIAQVSSLATVVTFPPAVRRMLRKNLALELAPSYPSAVVSKLLLKQAAESKAQFKSSNVRPLIRSCDPGLTNTGGAWNINTGSYKR